MTETKYYVLALYVEDNYELEIFETKEEVEQWYEKYHNRYESVMVVAGEKVATTKNELRWLDD